MLIKELLQLNESNSISIADAHGTPHPEDNELLAHQGLSSVDMEYELPIHQMSFNDLMNLTVKTQDEQNDIMSQFEKYATKQQIDSVKNYQINPSNDIIILDGNVIIDGHHRTVAAILKKRGLRYIDIKELPVTEAKKKKAKKKKDTKPHYWGKSYYSSYGSPIKTGNIKNDIPKIKYSTLNEVESDELSDIIKDFIIEMEDHGFTTTIGRDMIAFTRTDRFIDITEEATIKKILLEYDLELSSYIGNDLSHIIGFKIWI